MVIFDSQFSNTFSWLSRSVPTSSTKKTWKIRILFVSQSQWARRSAAAFCCHHSAQGGKENREKEWGDVFTKELAEHPLSPPLTLRKTQCTTVQYLQQHSKRAPTLAVTPSKSVCCSILGCGLLRKGYTWFVKICSKTIRGLPFFFHSPLDIVHLINDQDTLGAEVKHTVQIKEVEMW